MNNKKLMDTIKNLGIFIAGSTFNNYYIKILNAKEIREQAAKDLIKEKQMNIMNNNVSGVKSMVSNYKIDMNSKLNSIEKKLENFNKISENNKSDQILSKIKSRLETITEKKEEIEKIVSGFPEANPENSSILTENLKEISGALDNIKDAIDSYESNSFISNLNLNKFYEFLDSLSFIQELAFLHIMLFLVLLCVVFNILAIFFSNEIIKYFKIESKFPSLATFFKLRNTYQRYYLMWNISLMFIICFAAIYIDILTFYINP